MAYRNRGGFSSVGDGSFKGDSGSPRKTGGFSSSSGSSDDSYDSDRTGFSFFSSRIITLIIVSILVGLYVLISYEPSIIDPLEGTKKILFFTNISIVLGLLVFTLLASIIFRYKKTLLILMFVFLSIEIISLFVTLGVKLGLNSTYTPEKFGEIYDQEIGNRTSVVRNNSNIVSTLTRVKANSQKDAYVGECLMAYKIFSYRMYCVYILNAYLLILLTYESVKIYRIQDRKSQLEKDDVVVYDEEENVKF